VTSQLLQARCAADQTHIHAASRNNLLVLGGKHKERRVRVLKSSGHLLDGWNKAIDEISIFNYSLCDCKLVFKVSTWDLPMGSPDIMMRLAASGVLAKAAT
jgi:hypothetical protein